MSGQPQNQMKMMQRSYVISERAGFLQRQCSCSHSKVASDECEGCRRKREGTLQRAAVNGVPANSVPPIVHDVLNTPGQPLDAGARAFMEPRFGHDFSGVRVHTDARAAESARSVNALAYTVGRNVVFGTGQYAPETDAGKKLLAHELTHVVQQSASIQRAGPQKDADFPQVDVYERQAQICAESVLNNRSVKGQITDHSHANSMQRASIGSKVTHTKSRSTYRHISATFDGQDFILIGDGIELLKVSAQSGRPIGVRPKDAKSCKGSKGDSYLNNPHYVGIADNGPIPEGEYKFDYTSMATFDATERYEMIAGGSYTDPFGQSLHGGDWGAGRVALNPVHILPSPFCGSTTMRSGFYLHGGVLPGSSGCIDIGNTAYEKVVSLLDGYHAPIHVFVKYTHTAPSVGSLERAVGRFTYPSTGGHDPSIGDRLKSLFGGDPEE